MLRGGGGRLALPAQLRKYLDLWWALDATRRFELELITVDRFGQHKVYDLRKCAFADLLEDDPGAAQANHQL